MDGSALIILFTCILILVIAIPTLHSLRSRERELG